MGSDRMKKFATRDNDKAVLLLSLFFFGLDIRFSGVTNKTIHFQFDFRSERMPYSLSHKTMNARENFRNGLITT